MLIFRRVFRHWKYLLIWDTADLLTAIPRRLHRPRSILSLDDTSLERKANMDDRMHQSGIANQHRLVVDRLSSNLTESLWLLIENEQKDDVLAPVTVITPTPYARLALRQELGRTGFANVRFILLPVLSELLGAADARATGTKAAHHRDREPGGAADAG